MTLQQCQQNLCEVQPSASNISYLEDCISIAKVFFQLALLKDTDSHVQKSDLCSLLLCISNLQLRMWHNPFRHGCFSRFSVYRFWFRYIFTSPRIQEMSRV